MRHRVEPAPGKAHVLVLDRDDRVLRWVTAEYANAALDRGEVERTEHDGTVRVALRPDVDFVPVNGNGKAVRPGDPPTKRRNR